MDAGQLIKLLSGADRQLPVLVVIGVPIEISQETVERLRERNRYVDYVETEKDYPLARIQVLDDCVALYVGEA